MAEKSTKEKSMNPLQKLNFRNKIATLLIVSMIAATIFGVCLAVVQYAKQTNAAATLCYSGDKIACLIAANN